MEGCLEEGQAVVVVEDVITTGNSALRACRAVEDEGARVQAVLALVDREEGGRAALEGEGYRVIALVTLSELTARTPTEG